MDIIKLSSFTCIVLCSYSNHVVCNGFDVAINGVRNIRGRIKQPNKMLLNLNKYTGDEIENERLVCIAIRNPFKTVNSKQIKNIVRLHSKYLE